MSEDEDRRRLSKAIGDGIDGCSLDIDLESGGGLLENREDLAESVEGLDAAANFELLLLEIQLRTGEGVGNFEWPICKGVEQFVKTCRTAGLEVTPIKLQGRCKYYKISWQQHPLMQEFFRTKD